MKSGQIFWGFLLLCVGALFFLVKYDVIMGDFGFIWDIWPFIFILWGAMVIFKNQYVRPVVSALFGVFIGLLIFGFLHNVFSNAEWSDDIDYKDSHYESYVQEYTPEIKKAELDFKSGGGVFLINNTSDELIKGESYGNLAGYDFSCDQTDSAAYIDFRYEKRNYNFFRGKLKNRVEMSLNVNPIWKFRFDFGAAKANFDLSNYKVEYVKINTGAANVDLKLGDEYKSTVVDVDMGAASLSIDIPETSGCRLHGDMVLMAKNLHGFSKRNSGYYETDNYDYAENKVDIKINGGVSSLNIYRY